MYFPNVISLKQFYASALGSVAHTMIAACISRMWPNASGEAVLAVGYPTPYLQGIDKDAATLVVCMPGLQGAVVWPAEGGNRVCLCDEAELPLPDSSFNRVLLMHTIEHSEQLRGLLEEVWRVLTPSGRVLVVAPNRLSLWARVSHTPFGYGRPFSLHQMRELLEHCNLTYLRSQSALFALPFTARWIIKSARFIEFMGRLLLPMFGGVLVVEAEKQIYATLAEPVKRKRYKPIISTAQPQAAMRRKNIS